MSYRLTKLDAKDLGQYREVSCRFDMAKATAHVSPVEYRNAYVAWCDLWEKFYAKYGLDEGRYYAVGTATGVLMVEREPDFVPWLSPSEAAEEIEEDATP